MIATECAEAQVNKILAEKHEEPNHELQYTIKQIYALLTLSVPGVLP